MQFRFWRSASEVETLSRNTDSQAGYSRRRPAAVVVFCMAPIHPPEGTLSVISQVEKKSSNQCQGPQGSVTVLQRNPNRPVPAEVGGSNRVPKKRLARRTTWFESGMVCAPTRRSSDAGKKKYLSVTRVWLRSEERGTRMGPSWTLDETVRLSNCVRAIYYINHLDEMVRLSTCE